MPPSEPTATTLFDALTPGPPAAAAVAIAAERHTEPGILDPEPEAEAERATCPECGDTYDRRAQWVRRGEPVCYACSPWTAEPDPSTPPPAERPNDANGAEPAAALDPFAPDDLDDDDEPDELHAGPTPWRTSSCWPENPPPTAPGSPHAITVEGRDGWHYVYYGPTKYRGACACGWTGPTHTEPEPEYDAHDLDPGEVLDPGPESRAAHDALDHAYPGWRDRALTVDRGTFAMGRKAAAEWAARLDSRTDPAPFPVFTRRDNANATRTCGYHPDYGGRFTVAAPPDEPDAPPQGALF